MSNATPSAPPAETYRVRYYDRDLSHRGQGVQVRTFTDRAEAEAFAAVNKLYARPCKVEVVS
jgi:hypothetical protein